MSKKENLKYMESLGCKQNIFRTMDESYLSTIVDGLKNNKFTLENFLSYIKDPDFSVDQFGTILNSLIKGIDLHQYLKYDGKRLYYITQFMEIDSNITDEILEKYFGETFSDRTIHFILEGIKKGYNIDPYLKCNWDEFNYILKTLEIGLDPSSYINKDLSYLEIAEEHFKLEIAEYGMELIKDRLKNYMLKSHRNVELVKIEFIEETERNRSYFLGIDKNGEQYKFLTGNKNCYNYFILNNSCIHL